MVVLRAGSFPDLMDRSVLELAGPVMDDLPGRFEGIFFIGGSRSPVRVGERKGRSAVGVVDGDMKATFLFTSTVMEVDVVIVAVVFVVAFEPLLVTCSCGWGIWVRVEVRVSSSAGLWQCKAGWLDCVGVCVGVDEELAVVEDSVGSRAGGCSIGGSCLEDNSGSGLEDLTGLGVAVINGVGGQSGRGPN